MYSVQCTLYILWFNIVFPPNSPFLCFHVIFEGTTTKEKIRSLTTDITPTAAEMRLAVVSGNVTGEAPVSYWLGPSNNPRSLCES